MPATDTPAMVKPLLDAGATPRPWALQTKSHWSIETNARAILGGDFAVAWCPAWDQSEGPHDGEVAVEEALANAALIVTAVNERDILIKALGEDEYNALVTISRARSEK